MSKGLKILNEIRTAPSFMGGNDRYRYVMGSDALFTRDCDIIEKELKALEIIKNKETFSIFDFKYCDTVEEYNELYSKDSQLTQEEFDLLKEVLADD